MSEEMILLLKKLFFAPLPTMEHSFHLFPFTKNINHRKEE